MDDISELLHAAFLGAVIGAGSLYLAIAFSGRTYSDGVNAVRMEALEAGVAEWPRNGEFKWKESTQ